MNADTLERMAKEARAKEAADAAAKELAEKQQLVGKCFYKVSIQRSWCSWHALKYVAFRVENGVLQMQVRRLGAYFYSNKRIPCDTNIGRSCTASWEPVHSGTCMDPHWDMLPYDTARFDDLWTAIGNKARAFIRDRQAEPDQPVPEPYGEDSDHLREGALVPDIPFVALSPALARFLPNEFMLPGYRYILTPGSRAAGLAMLDEDAARLARCAHLFEACDTAYVRGVTTSIRELRAMLVETPK